MKQITSVVLTIATLTSFARAQNPQPYCTAGVSSNFCVAQIGANGQPNITNTAGCVITVSSVPANRQGLVFYGIDNNGFTPSAWAGGLSTSYLCVKAPIQRLGAPQNSGGTSGLCNGSYVSDWDAFQNANPTALGNPWLPGDRAFLQSWYRDPLAANTSNLSNALELTLLVAPPPPACSMTFPGLVPIPAGTFLMGSSAASGSPYNGDSRTQPVHQVTLSYCFWMGEKEVTQAQYLALMGVNPSFDPHPIHLNHPVDRVTWTQARAYCAALTAQQSALGNVPLGYEYRLPTEAEWEYACRAGTTTEFNFGASLNCSQARVDYSYHSSPPWCWASYTLPAGSYAPNAWGLYDMHGNVFEWCLDSFSGYAPGAATDPFVTGGARRVLRGGAYAADSSMCRSAFRWDRDPFYVDSVVGFRVVLAPILAP